MGSDPIYLSRVVSNASFTNDGDFDLAGVAQFSFDLERDGAGEVLGFEVGNIFRMNEDADFTAGL
jgi:hypothetical protein